MHKTICKTDNQSNRSMVLTYYYYHYLSPPPPTSKRHGKIFHRPAVGAISIFERKIRPVVAECRYGNVKNLVT